MYDADSNLISTTDENGSVTTFTYDALNRAIAEEVNRTANVIGTSARTYHYDGLSRRVRATDNNEPAEPNDDAVTTYAYDSLSRLIEETQMQGNGPLRTGLATEHVVSNAWRAENLRVDLTYPNSHKLTYRHDDLDRVQTIQGEGSSATPTSTPSPTTSPTPSSTPTPTPSGTPSSPNIHLPLIAKESGQLRAASDVALSNANSAAPVVMAEYSYIGRSRLLARTYANGTQMTFLNAADLTDRGYDGARRPTRLRHLRSDGSLIVGFAHAYDRMDNKLTEAKLHDTANSEGYAYDSAYRLIDFQRGMLAANGMSITTPSPNARQAETWRLDGVGNWSQTTHTDAGATETENRDHTSFNELHHRENGISEDYNHDSNGNLTEDANHRYEWDARNRLRTVMRKTDSKIVAVYTYDAQNRRIRKVVTNSADLNGTTNYLYSGWQVIEERDGSDTLVQQYTYGATYVDEVITLDRNMDGNTGATDENDVRYYYHQNTLYSVFALTDAGEAIREQSQYDAYGRATTTGDAGNPYLFTGRRFDEETGFHQYRMRYFSAVQGRFISRDQLGIQTSNTNLYEYVDGAPTVYVDPSGLMKWVLKNQTSKPSKDEWSEYTYSGSHWVGSDDSSHGGGYHITPTSAGGSAAVNNVYWHTYTKFWARSEHKVNAKWHRQYQCNQKDGTLELVDGEGPKGKFNDGIAYAHMKVAIAGEGSKKVHITVELKTGASANVTVGATAGLEGSAGGHEGKLGGKVTLGSSFTWQGAAGISRGATKDWFVECACVP